MLEKKIIEKFFNGKATKADIELIAEYIYSDSADKDLQSILSEEFVNNNVSLTLDKKKNFIQILDKIKEEKQNKIRVRQNVLNHFYKTAAIIMLLVGLGWLFMRPELNNTMPHELAEDQRIILKLTEKGQKLRLNLPDGSMVILNSMSSIEYPDGLEKDKRTVKIQGEAYFEVLRDSLRPFTVSFGESKVKVLGTSFNINSRDAENAEVALVEGKISVEDNNGDHIEAIPGEMVKITEAGLIKEIFDYQSIIGWKDGWLSFENDNFNKLKTRLEMWYGVEFEIQGSPVQEYHYTGRYRNKSLKEILDGISYVMKFDYELNNNKVIVFFHQKNM